MNNLIFLFCKEPFKCPPLHMYQRRRFFFSWFLNVHCLFRNLNLFFLMLILLFIFCFILFCFFSKFGALLICVCPPLLWAGKPRSASCHVERSRNIFLFARKADTACRVPTVTGVNSNFLRCDDPYFAKRGSHFCAHTNWPVLPAFSSTLQTHIHAQNCPTGHSRAHSEPYGRFKFI